MGTKIAVLAIAALLVGVGLRAIAGESESVSTAASPAPPVKAQDVLFYSDLGPDRIDVSAYPSEQRRNYAVYARACSRCHGLARSINAPYASRGWWEFYMASMRVRGSVAGRPFSREEVKAVLDFLEYDSRARKVEHADAFNKSTAELRRRFDAVVDQRMSDLQNEPQPRLLP